MKWLLRERGALLTASLLFGLVLLARGIGLLAPLENYAADIRARLLQHEVASDIVIVGIDARSLADLQQWPWPRRYHARVLERLAEAQPRQVLLDIDFSSRTTAEEDESLRAAIAGFASSPVILPAFFQRASAAIETMTVTKPLPELAEHAVLAGINFEPGRDSLVREMTLSWNHGDASLISASALVAGVSAETQRKAAIDFSISPTSFEYVSYVDLLAGRIPPETLRDKTVLIGATAVELGDMLPVPIYHWQPGVVVQALAAQSLRQGPLNSVPQWLHDIVLAMLALVVMLYFNSHNWRHNVLAAAAAVIPLATAALYAYSAHRLIIDIVPALAVLGGAFLIATIRSLDRETLRALAYALGIRRRDALLGSIVESSTDCIVCIDASGRIETANAAGAQLFGCELSSLIAAPLVRFVPVLSGPLHELCGRVSEQTGVKADGSEFPVELSVSPVSTPGESLFTVIIRDISERKAQQERLQYQATHDPLTSLPNRAALAAHLEEILASTPDRRIALLMLDLCRFKEVNDTLGHHVGDQVLCEVARRFATAPGIGFVARIGGDEFTMVCRPTEHAALTKVAQTLHDTMRAPIEAEGIAIDIGLSIGIAIADRHASDAATLLRQADVAMYVAKRRGSPWEFYDPANDQNSVRRLAMVGDLRHAISAGTLSLHYQPQVDLRNGRSFSAEALLRWRHPDHGAISPAEFISVAESTDLIRPLTFWTLSQALAQAAQWRREGFEPRVAINLSARLLQDTDFPAQLRALLETHDAEPSNVELEITESAVMQDPARSLRVVREIHALGVFMSVDDFGTGYSSLAYLRDLPVHALKLDKSFVQNLHESARDRSIVNSTVRMAHELGLQVVAEGVENEWSAGYLAEIGYDYAQGYRYSPALQADQCRRWMEDFNAAASSRREQHSVAV